MKMDLDILHRRSIRLKGYDYSQSGAYFITICAYNRLCLFGKINNGQMLLNNYGEIIRDEWLKTGQIRKNILLDEFIVMPNHIHGIIIIDNCRGTVHRAPTCEQFGNPTSNTIPTIVRSFKAAVTKRINENYNSKCVSVWQRNYYEQIIRNEIELNSIREYIVNNSLKWEFDSENVSVNKRRLR